MAKEMSYWERRRICKDYDRACRNGRIDKRRRSLKRMFGRHTGDE